MRHRQSYYYHERNVLSELVGTENEMQTNLDSRVLFRSQVIVPLGKYGMMVESLVI